MLIAAARDAGKLDALSAELALLAVPEVENGRALWALAEIARGRGAGVKPMIQAMAADLPRQWPQRLAPAAGVPPAWPEILVARACLADPALASLGEAMARDLATHAERAQATEFQQHLVRYFAAARENAP